VTVSFPLRITLRHIRPAALVVDLAGDINGQAEPALDEAFVEIAASQPDTLVLNFGEVAYINSTGIALIIGLLTRARQHHVGVLAYGLSEHYREIFDITRLSDYISVYPDERAALASMPGAA
jgi:anti-anti-sigma factor